MNYRVEEKPPFVIAGKGIRVNQKESFTVIPKFWGSIAGTERLYTLQKHDGLIGKAVLGVCSDFNSEPGKYTYSIAVEADQNADFGEYDRIDIPALTWAVFTSAGSLPDAIQAVWTSIFSEFFPAGNYSPAPGVPQVEVYPPGDVSSDGYRCEVWIPVVAK